MIITIANRKGGSGKTTCCVNIGVAAAMQGHKVAFIDMDPQQTLTSWFKKGQNHPHTLSLLSHGVKTSPAYLKHIFAQIKENAIFDYCFIDTPGYDSDFSRVSLSMADLVVIPCKTVGVDMEAATQTIAYSEREKKPVLFLISQVVERTPFEEFLPIFSAFSKRGVLIPSYLYVDNSYAASLSSGKTIFDFAKKGLKEDITRAWNFIEEYWQEIKIKQQKAREDKKTRVGSKEKDENENTDSESENIQVKRKRGRPKKSGG